MHDNDELLDLVSRDDEVIGTIYRSEYDKLFGDSPGYIRASELFLLNNLGQLWIPVRTTDKKIAPGGFDYSAAGHVESGDTYEQTILRETQEEINLSLQADQLEYVAKLVADDTRYITTIYLHRSSVTPDYNPQDFTGAKWMLPSELLDAIAAGHPAKVSLARSVGLLIDYLAK